MPFIPQGWYSFSMPWRTGRAWATQQHSPFIRAPDVMSREGSGLLTCRPKVLGDIPVLDQYGGSVFIKVPARGMNQPTGHHRPLGSLLASWAPQGQGTECGGSWTGGWHASMQRDTGFAISPWRSANSALWQRVAEPGHCQANGRRAAGSPLGPTLSGAHRTVADLGA